MASSKIARAQLGQIAMAVNAVTSLDDERRVLLGMEVSPGVIAALRALPGAVHFRRGGFGYVVESVKVTVDGVLFEAQRTAMEVA